MSECIKYVNSYLEENTYLIGDDTCYIIDPGSDGKNIQKLVNEKFKGVKAILLTHAHIDHILSVDYLAEVFRCPVYLHLDDSRYIDGSYKDHPMMGHAIVTLKTPVIDAMEIPDKNIIVYHTPGHSKGSVCYHFKQEGYLFTGDTLFERSIGRVDLPGGSMKAMWDSLRLLKTLPDDLKVFPGHEGNTILGEEKKHNRYYHYL